MVTPNEKQELKNQLVACLKKDKDIQKVVIFGAFVTSDEPRNMDVAVFQESREGYIKLSMKYRKLEVLKIVGTAKRKIVKRNRR